MDWTLGSARPASLPVGAQTKTLLNGFDLAKVQKNSASLSLLIEPRSRDGVLETVAEGDNG